MEVPPPYYPLQGPGDRGAMAGRIFSLVQQNGDKGVSYGGAQSLIPEAYVLCFFPNNL